MKRLAGSSSDVAFGLPTELGQEYRYVYLTPRSGSISDIAALQLCAHLQQSGWRLHVLCCKFSEQRLRLLQIARVEPFREPAVDRSKQFARLLRLALVAPEAREAHGCAEFPGFCLLHSRDRQCTYLGMTFLMRTTAPLGQYIACGSLIIGCDSSVASSGTPSIATIDCACEGIISTAISLSSAQKRQSNRSAACSDDRRYGFLSARRQHPLQQWYQGCGRAFTLTAIAESP